MFTQLFSSLGLVLLTLVLVLLNGFFVASEFAIVKVRRTRLQELAGQGVRQARLSLLCLDHLNEVLSATQLGITLVSLALGWIGKDAFLGLFRLIVPNLTIEPASWMHWFSLGVSFSVITVLHVVLGELVPKTMAIQDAERITLLVVRPLGWFLTVSRPVIQVLTKVANAISAFLGFPNESEEKISEEELKLVMKESHKDGIISESEAQIISRAFEFSDKRVADIMISAENADFVSLRNTVDQNLKVIRRNNHTRFPLCRTDLQTVIGVVHIKDVWPYLAESRSNHVFPLSSRPPVYVDPGMRQDQLLKLFNEKRVHLAVVQDPRSRRNIGIVTIEDILEELVGDITDEYDHRPTSATQPELTQ